MAFGEEEMDDANNVNVPVHAEIDEKEASSMEVGQDKECLESNAVSVNEEATVTLNDLQKEEEGLVGIKSDNGFAENKNSPFSDANNGSPLPIVSDSAESDANTEHSSSGNGTEEERRCRGEKRKFRECYIPFIQDGFCYAYSKNVSRCRDCKNRIHHSNSLNNVCRFTYFRKIQAVNTGKYPEEVEGFCDPILDPTTDDVKLWLPSMETTPGGLELEVCSKLITQLGDQLCELIRKEQEAVAINNRFGANRPVYWKRSVEEVREMCDVCATTLFNYHWTCGTCGFMVCLDCVSFREKNAPITPSNLLPKDAFEILGAAIKDKYRWLHCTGDVSHEPKNLLLTQIIPSNVLKEMGEYLHKIRSVWGIPQYCDCTEAGKYSGSKFQPFVIKELKDGPAKPQDEELSTLVALPEKEELNKNNSSDDESDDEGTCNLSNMLMSKKEKSEDVQPNGLSKQETQTTSNGDFIPVVHAKEVKQESNLEILQPSNKMQEESKSNDKENTKPEIKELKHYVRTEASFKSYYERLQPFPIRVSSVTETHGLYSELEHMWLCSGTLLRLMNPSSADNYGIFNDLWKRGQPVLVSNVSKKLKDDLWTPSAFKQDFGSSRHDLINCMNGKVVQNQQMSTFWDGFLDVSKRLVDDKGMPMLLKLKDWPPGDDFAKMMPSRFSDLMDALPLKEYTHRSGRLNLAARLPGNFMTPDLGPKMYIAYGDGNHLENGTTNLHLDISDAVNCMVYVGVPTNCDIPKHNKAVLRAIEDSDCDVKTVERVTKHHELAGALWHIYRPWDADKIRDMLNKVSVERGQSIEKNHDPIHDQVAYLDKELRKRLRTEYNVIGFPIVQCAGDAVFIPAGAPHQVRNLHNCIKIAEDFVSPENVSHCFQLTEEFRSLSDTHTNHEDKLQIKNIVYHAVKDALSVLMQTKGGESGGN